MDAKDYLRQIERQKRYIERLKGQLADLEVLAEYRPSVMTEEPKGAKKPIDEMYNTIIELKAKIDVEIARLSQMYKDITSKLDSLSNPERGAVLYQRFILGKSIKQVASDLDKSIPWVKVASAQGLIEFKRLYIA